MKVILMGTGTSHGVPVMSCHCAVCTSRDPRDWRNRCSAFICEPAQVVIDTGPEFRLQALRYGVERLDAVLLTHGHADHLNGLDDVRIFSHTKSVDPSKPQQDETEGEGLPLYANARTLQDVQKRFDYVFTPVREGGGKPKIRLVDADGFSAEHPLVLNGLELVPVPLLHGTLPNCGWLLRQGGTSIAYLTDCNAVPPPSIELLRQASGRLEHLVIDALRMERHSTHFSFLEALAVAEQLAPRHTWFTHLTHTLLHTQVQEVIDEHLPEFPALNAVVRSKGTVAPAYDGLVLEA